MKGEEYSQADIAASFQKAVTDVLVGNAMHAVKNMETENLRSPEVLHPTVPLEQRWQRPAKKKAWNFIIPLRYTAPTMQR